MIGTRLLDRYELLAELGRGGMGIVYRARDHELGREVAVKMIPPTRFTDKTERRFRREARIVAQMDHPAIVPIYDFGRHGRSFFFVMPWLEGRTLREMISVKSLRLGETVAIAVQVATALEYSHSRGVVHRDVKPENVMVSREEGELRVRLMDFGLAQETDDSRLTETNPLRGTITYMSPEQIQGVEVDHRTDVYSLGVVLYEGLTGKPPFTGTTISVAYRIVNHSPPSPRAQGAAIDEELERIVLDCLAKRPAERPDSGEHLAALLLSYGQRLREDERRRPLVREEAAEGEPAPPLVGRDEEWREIVRRLEEAGTGTCQLVLIGGEAGTGKSRLLDELTSLARARGLRVLRGRVADRGALPYQGLCELLQDELRERPAVADLAQLGPELAAHFPALAELVDSPDPPPADAPGSGTDASEDPIVLFELLARALAQLAGGEPRVLLLESLHAGEVTIEALDYIVRRLAATPTLVVGTYRPMEVGRGHPLRRMLDGFRDDRRMASLSLGPFSHEELRQWLERFLEGAPEGTEGKPELDAALVSQLADATEGNPFFCHELVRSLLEAGDLCRDANGVWTLAGGLAGAALPATIHEAVESRVGNLSAAEGHVLAAASVLGRGFDDRDLEDLVDEDVDLDAALDALVERKLLVEEPGARGDRLAFTSRVVRDVLYRDLPRQRRRGLHRRHAEALERRHRDRPERVYPRLVEHFSAGGAASKTVCYALEMARSALAAFANEDAAAAVETALAFLDEDDVAERERLRGELHLIRAQARRGTGELQRAFRDAERAAGALDRAGEPSRAAEAALLAAEIAWQSRRVGAVRRTARLGIELARRAGAGKVLRRVLQLAATEANLRGEHDEARRYLEEAERSDRPARREAEEAPRGGHLTTTLAQAVTTVDPGEIVTVEEFEVVSCVFETLLATDAQGSVVPALCEAWHGDDGWRGWELVLREEARFSDGRTVVARDVKRSFERAARRAASTAVPALTALQGFDAFRARESPEIAGIEVLGERRLRFRLNEPLPIFPALLTNLKTAIVCEGGASRRGVGLLGTGPFRILRRQEDRVVLERNPNDWRSSPALLETLEFRTAPDPAAIASGLLRGEIDLGRDLVPEDLEEILRQQELRAGLVEATKKNVYFVLLNTRSPRTENVRVRRALTGAVAVKDLVYRTLGRFAQPATGLIPPGIFGHVASRREPTLRREEARGLLRASGLPVSSSEGPPIRLKAAVHPIFLSRYSSLLGALFDEWAELGVEVEVREMAIEAFRVEVGKSSGVDLLLSRWIADYDDADNFTYELFHSRRGLLRGYYSSPGADHLAERARQEVDASLRQELYRKYEELLAREAVVLPLFHDVDYRIAGPRVRGLRLQNTPPYVDYARLGKLEDAPVARVWHRSGHGGEIVIPVGPRLASLDPAAAPLADRYEVVSTVFETLTRVDEGARVVPWLAAAIDTGDGGRSWDVRLRSDVRFHDGRRLSANDVRRSFERLLRRPVPGLRFPLLRIRGATAAQRELSGIEVLSPTRLRIELERPLESFPGFLTHPSTAIVPEGSEELMGTWREGCEGTGPFRVVDFAPGERLVVERNPHYWRVGYPKSERLLFRFGLAPGSLSEALQKGRLTLAAGLPPADAEALRSRPGLAEGYRESPRLITYFLVLQTRRGPLADPELRRAFARVLGVERALRETVGRWANPAFGLIPPGLLGYEPPGPARSEPASGERRLKGLRLQASLIDAFGGPYAGFWKRLVAHCRDFGVKVDARQADVSQVLRRGREGGADLLAMRWVAIYPDTDGFVAPLLDSRTGFLAGLLDVPEIDRLLEEGRSVSDLARRHSIYRQIDGILEREALLVPLFYEPTYRFCQAGVRGLRFGLTVPEVLYEELYLER